VKAEQRPLLLGNRGRREGAGKEGRGPTCDGPKTFRGAGYSTNKRKVDRIGPRRFPKRGKEREQTGLKVERMAALGRGEV